MKAKAGCALLHISLVSRVRVRPDPVGLAGHRAVNAMQRANGNEPKPGQGAGIKRWARYLKRAELEVITPKRPSRYLNRSARA